MRDMACGGPYFSRILLNAIYFGAAKFSPRLELRKVATDVRTAGWKFRDRVRDLLGRALDYSNITTIQALLLMCNSLFALGDEPSAAWLYVGNARSMIIDLGLHVDVTSRSNLRHLSDEDIEIRRRVFWAAFGTFRRLLRLACNYFTDQVFQSSIKSSPCIKAATLSSKRPIATFPSSFSTNLKNLSIGNRSHTPHRLNTLDRHATTYRRSPRCAS